MITILPSLAETSVLPRQLADPTILPVEAVPVTSVCLLEQMVTKADKQNGESLTEDPIPYPLPRPVNLRHLPLLPPRPPRPHLRYFFPMSTGAPNIKTQPLEMDEGFTHSVEVMSVSRCRMVTPLKELLSSCRSSIARHPGSCTDVQLLLLPNRRSHHSVPALRWSRCRTKRSDSTSLQPQPMSRCR